MTKIRWATLASVNEPLLFTARRILIYVEDLEQAIAYYRDVLGFKPLHGVDGVNFEFATSGPPVVLHKGGKSSKDPRGLVGPVPSFQVADINRVVDTYKQRGVRIVQDILDVSHGWLAVIADLEGNVIQVYQSKA